MKLSLKSIPLCLLVLLALAIPTLQAATLSWASSSGEVDGYYLFYGKTTSTPIKKINVGNKTQYNLDTISLTAGVKYYFWVTAYNAAGESNPTAPIAYSRGDSTPPSPPKGLLAD
jgi:hypothetical protein